MGKKEAGTSYRDAGVDLEAGAEAIERYKVSVRQTRIPGVMSSLGGFGGLFALRDAGEELRDPVLVSGTDGVGTKLRLAFELGIHDTIGVDCVAMCVNDVIVAGARPLFFLDYLATGRLDPSQAADVVSGIATACKECGCALIGGETAEMPGFYADGEYDVAGFCVGIAERDELIDPASVSPGDRLIGLASSGFHSNGYSLIRKIIADAELNLHESFGEHTLGEALLRPTRLYPAAFAALKANGIEVKSAAHITGGGFFENLPRALGEYGASIVRSWDVPKVIRLIADAGSVAPRERWSVFNMGIGMVLVVAPDKTHSVLQTLETAGYAAYEIGEVTRAAGVVIEGIDP